MWRDASRVLSVSCSVSMVDSALTVAYWADLLREWKAVSWDGTHLRTVAWLVVRHLHHRTASLLGVLRLPHRLRLVIHPARTPHRWRASWRVNR